MNRIASRLLAAAVTGAIALPAGVTAAAGQETGQFPASAVPVVKKWIDFLHDGKSWKAWQLMGRASKERIGSFEQFKSEKSAWATGWGAWATAQRRTFTVGSIASSDTEEVSAVTVTGRVKREGPYRRDAAAVPVITRGGASKVEPLASPARIRFIKPAFKDTVGANAIFRARIDGIGRENTVEMTIKNGQTATASLEKTGDHEWIATARFARPLVEGQHVVTLTLIRRAGVAAKAIPFTVDAG